MKDTSGHRLPRTVDPRRYRLTLAPDLEAASFSGEEQIEVQIHQPVQEIVLNAAELEIHSASLVTQSGDLTKADVRLEPEAGRAVIGLSRPASPGMATLQITFSGTLNDKLRGFYRSTFTDHEGKERVIATTQFEPTDARRAFPCWDEPDRKAVFSVTLVVDASLAAVSNSAVAEEVGLDGRRQVRFADTIPMSTYLVAFVVGPLETTEPVDVDGVALRVAHVPGKGSLTSFALDIGAHALRFFSSWFGIDYPGSKLDLIALPDFAHGAMENLGAVTFRESVLLIDPENAARVELERVADVVAHEIAHMWFGDLVTMRWWNGLWLNEAFATFMEMLCVDDFRPEWERWVTFGRSRGAALSTDGLPSTRPVEFPVGRPEEAEGMFDILTYEKGAGVLRMLERYLGSDPFRLGIRLYLESHRYANAETTDLWDSIETATGEPARHIMDSWIFQGGYPIVSVRADGRTLSLEQEPFRYMAAKRDDDAIGSGWQAPVLVRVGIDGSVHEDRVLLVPEGAKVELPGSPDWVVVNAGGWGFYRTRYTGDLLGRLTSGIQRMDALERFNLVSDTWASVVAGLSPMEDYLELLANLREEPDANVWNLVTTALASLDRAIPDEGREALQAYTRALLKPPFAKLGWKARPGDGEMTGTLRATLLEALGTTGADPDVRGTFAELHADFLSGGSSLEPDLANAAVSVVASGGGEPEYESFLQRFRRPATPQEEMRYLYGLAGFSQPALTDRTLDLCMSEVRTQNAGFVIQLLLANRSAGERTWDFVKSRWDDLLARLPNPAIPRMLDGVSALCRDPSLVSDIHAYCAAHPVPSGQRTVEQTLERLDVNAALSARESPNLATLLARRT